MTERGELTLALIGEVPLGAFAQAMGSWHILIGALTDEVTPGAAVEWLVSDMQAGSATATVRAEAPDREPVLRLVRAYGEVGQSLERREPVPFSHRVRMAARAVTDVVGGRVTAVHFRSDTLVARIERRVQPAEVGGGLRHSLGAITGTVQTISQRRGLRFVLYDSLFDRPVACHLGQGRQESMREAWGRRVRVTGDVARTPDGRPVEVHAVRDLEVLPDVRPGAFRLAKGTVDFGDKKPEELVRQVRDAWED